MSDQIKMFIAGEEVVSQNEFTINEEMLSASSTILNNCYPKSWELEKDYISNFYYPKDYSRFVLAQGEYLHGNQEFQPLEITGKNLFDDKSYNLINAYYVDSTGKIVYGNNNHLTWLKLKPNTTYTLTQTVVSNVTRRIALFSSEPVANLQGTLVGTFMGTTTINQTFTTTDTNIYVAWVFCNLANLNNHTENEMLASIQLEAGNQATTYEPYYQPNLSYETNVEKEWNSFNVYGNTYQKTSILPSEYTQVDYITSDGSAYIDTLLQLGTNFKIDLNFKSNSSVTSEQPIVSIWNSTDNYWNLFIQSGNRLDLYVKGHNYINNWDQNPITLNKKINVTITRSDDNFTLTQDENSKTFTNTTLTDNTTTLKLFKRGDRGGISYISIYGVTVWKNNQVAVNLIPCYRNSDNTIGMYDIINNVFYSNVGSGSFTYGSVLNIPSPDYPSELVSVGYENLFDIGTSNNDYLTVNDNVVSSSNINIDNNILSMRILSGGQTVAYRNLNLTANETYTIKALSSVSTGRYFVRLRNSSNTGYLTSSDISISGWTYNSFYKGWYKEFNSINMETTLSIPNCLYWQIGLGFNTGVGLNTIQTITNIIITKGTQQHSYIPYGKYGIEIVNTGKNLFNAKSISNSICSIAEDGTITMSGNTSSNGYCNTNRRLIDLCPTLKVGETYYAYVTNTDNKNYIYSSSLGYWTNGSSKTITQTMLDTNVIIYGGYNTTTTMKIMVTKSVDTTYEPYKGNTQLYILDEPLRQIGTYKDKLYTDGRVLYVERKIGSVILNGTENWALNSSSGNQYRYWLSSQNFKNVFDNVIIGSENALMNKFLCNYFTQALFSNTDIGKFSVNNLEQVNWFLLNSEETSVTNFKTWLSTHNTEINYVLATPTITPLGYIDLPFSYEGQNNVSIYTGLDTRIEIYYYWKNYDVLFAGVVKNSGDISLNPRHPHYCSLQILDYKAFLSESNTLDFVIANKTISEAIGMVVNAVSGYGFIVGNIDIDSANDIIGAYSTLNKSAYDVLQYLAEISGSRWRARVVDSLTMAIDFYDPDTLPQAEDIEYTQEYWENNNIVDLTFNYGTRDYRNKQILLSDEVYANINYDETLISNGYSNTFTLQNNIGNIDSIVVDGAEKTIGTNNDKQMGVEADFYFTPGKNVVESNSVYSAGTMIHLSYQPLVKGRQIVYNNSEVDRISQQTQTDGVIARYETRNDVLSSDELEKIAKTYIEYKGKAEVILTLRTQNKDLYNIGEVVYFNAPISDLAQNYMVKSKKTEYVVINKIVNLFYVYEMTSSFNSEKAINYFDNQRSKATGNIEEGESITRNVDIETQANIIWSEGSVSSATVTVTGDNILNCALNSPFVE